MTFGGKGLMKHRNNNTFTSFEHMLQILPLCIMLVPWPKLYIKKDQDLFPEVGCLRFRYLNILSLYKYWIGS
jgi:hypothetical protein